MLNYYRTREGTPDVSEEMAQARKFFRNNLLLNAALFAIGAFAFSYEAPLMLPLAGATLMSLGAVLTLFTSLAYSGHQDCMRSIARATGQAL